MLVAATTSPVLAGTPLISSTQAGTARSSNADAPRVLTGEQLAADGACVVPRGCGLTRSIRSWC
jgi:hypothetical protein